MTGLLWGVWIIVIFLAVCVYFLFMLVKGFGDLNYELRFNPITIKVESIVKKELSNISKKIDDISFDIKELTNIKIEIESVERRTSSIDNGVEDIKSKLIQKLYNT